MQIINKPIDELIPYDNNPRNNTKAVDKVANSIAEFGFKVPIVVSENNIIVAGHTRLLAAKKLGLKEVPVIIADDLTEKQIKAFRIADNKVAELSEWNNDLLFQELVDLEMDMTEFGFSQDELDALMNNIPDFAPGTLDEQGDLTTLEPKWIKCPHCGEEFDVNAKD